MKLEDVGYSKYSFTAEMGANQSKTHDVYEKGSGPVVVIIQELPGIGEETLRLADNFINQGFCVVLPHLFGPLGRTSMPVSYTHLTLPTIYSV